MLYEYECQICRTVFEVYQKITDDPLDKAECPTCHKEQLVKKVIGAPTFFLKGKGWAKDGYCKDTKKCNNNNNKG